MAVLTGLAAQDKLLAWMPLFSGLENAFRSYQFVMETVLGESTAIFTQDFDTLKLQVNPIEIPDININPNANQRARTLYFVLVMTTRGEAQIIVQTVPKHNGYEAYRMICLAYDPSTMTKGLGMLDILQA